MKVETDAALVVFLQSWCWGAVDWFSVVCQNSLQLLFNLSTNYTPEWL